MSFLGNSDTQGTKNVTQQLAPLRYNGYFKWENLVWYGTNGQANGTEKNPEKDKYM